MSGELILAQVGSMRAAMARLWALEATILQPPAAGALNVYSWWQPDMLLPALYNWMTPGEVTADGVPLCKSVDTLRITIVIAVEPTAVAGAGDMLEISEYFDLAQPILDAELYSRHPLGQRNARRLGAQTAADELGGAAILTLELPIEIELHHPVQTTP